MFLKNTHNMATCQKENTELQDATPHFQLDTNSVCVCVRAHTCAYERQRRRKFQDHEKMSEICSPLLFSDCSKSSEEKMSLKSETAVKSPSPTTPLLLTWMVWSPLPLSRWASSKSFSSLSLSCCRVLSSWVTFLMFLRSLWFSALLVRFSEFSCAKRAAFSSRVAS